VAATADYLASATLGPEEHLFLSDLIGRRKGREVELGPSFGRFLTAKTEFSYEAVQTVNLLALRLQWFESLLPKPCGEATSRLPEPIRRHRVNENNHLSLYPITSHN
jgi:hypothetical protein